MGWGEDGGFGGTIDKEVGEDFGGLVEVEIGAFKRVRADDSFNGVFELELDEVNGLRD